MPSQPPSKRPTLKDIATAVGVSITTVSYVLNDTGTVTPEVRKRVRAAAAKLGYRTNQTAKATRTGRTNTIGLILPDLTNPFFAQLTQPIQARAHQAGYGVLLFDSHGDVEWERRGAADLLARGADGIIWCPVGETDTLADLRGAAPVVVIDRPLPGYDSVAADSFSGGAQMADHLLAHGHQVVGLVSGPLSLASARARREGFCSRFLPRGRIAWETENPFSIELSTTAAGAIDTQSCSVIVCGNDLIAFGVIRHLHERGVHVSGDISVVGFDDIMWSSFATPGLTTVRQPFAALGGEALDLLMRRINGDAGPRVGLSLAMSITERNSLRALASAEI